jgi:hypothetical protein
MASGDIFLFLINGFSETNPCAGDGYIYIYITMEVVARPLSSLNLHLLPLQ